MSMGGEERPPLLLIGTVSTGCSKLGLGGGSGSPTAPTGPPSAGSTIIYSAIGASDAKNVAAPKNGLSGGSQYFFLPCQSPLATVHVPIVKPAKMSGARAPMETCPN